MRSSGLGFYMQCEEVEDDGGHDFRSHVQVGAIGELVRRSEDEDFRLGNSLPHAQHMVDIALRVGFPGDRQRRHQIAGEILLGVGRIHVQVRLMVSQQHFDELRMPLLENVGGDEHICRLDLLVVRAVVNNQDDGVDEF